MLQCASGSFLVCCSVLQCAVACSSMIQWDTVCCSVVCFCPLQRVAACCSMLQCVAVSCSMLQRIAVRCSVLQCVAVCFSYQEYRAQSSNNIVWNPIKETIFCKSDCHVKKWEEGNIVWNRNSNSYSKLCYLSSNNIVWSRNLLKLFPGRGGGLGSRPKKMYGGRLGDGVEYHSMKPTPRR